MTSQTTSRPISRHKKRLLSTLSSRFPAIWAMFGGAFVGCVFFLIIYSTKVLHVTYVNWIRNASGDFTQSYYGWKFFRASDWHWPIGLMDGVAYPNLTPIMYIDSVPIFDIIFKILSPLLPETFQFFGIWGICCFALNGAISSKIIHFFTKNTIFSIVTSTFFTLTTFSIQRLYTHTALAANWVILLAILLIITYRNTQSIWKNSLYWFLLFFMSISVNMYYVPIIGIMMAMHVLYNSLILKKYRIGITELISSVLGAIVAFYLYGGFYHLSSTSVNGGGLGDLNANLNSLINPLETGLYLTGESLYMKTLPTTVLGQYEGYAYLGIGLILLAFIALAGTLCQPLNRIHAIWRTRQTPVIFVGITIILLFIASFGTKITLNDKILLNIPYPDFFLKIYGIFRSTGRFMWGVWDIVALIIIITVYKTYSQKITAILLISICLIIQIYDLSPMIAKRQKLYGVTQQPYSSLIQTSNLDKMLRGKKHVTILSDEQLVLQAYYDIAEEILARGITTNDFYYSRRDTKAIESFNASEKRHLLSGKPSTDTLYIFDSFQTAKKYGSSLHLYYLAGLLWGSFSPIAGLKEITSITPVSSKQFKYGKLTIPINGDTLGIQIDGQGANSIENSTLIGNVASDLKHNHDSGDRVLGIIDTNSKQMISFTDKSQKTVRLYSLEMEQHE